MIRAGSFVVWYWAPVLISGASVLGSNPLTRSIESFTSGVAGLVTAQPVLVGVIVALVGLALWLKTPSPEDTGESVDHGVASHRH